MVRLGDRRAAQQGIIDCASRAVLASRLSNTMDTRFCVDRR
jgi:hypothetical protein